MTYFMFDQDEGAAYIVTDTLVTDAENNPVKFQHKVWAVPQMNLVFAVTGTANVGEELHQFLTASLTPRDISELDASAPELLRAIHAELERRHGDIGTSTVYVFGFPSGSSRLVRYTYRSVRDYESERSEQTGVATRPVPQTFKASVPTTIPEYIELAERIRAENDAAESSEPVKIGGHLILTAVQSRNVITRHIHTFADAEEHRAQMEARA